MLRQHRNPLFGHILGKKFQKTGGKKKGTLLSFKGA